jgi:oxygen-independent coproporphyrinogen-3 oxidase
MEEFMFLGLRRTEGVDPDRFRQCFGSDLSGVYGPVIQKFLKIGLLEWQSGRLRLTEHGMDVSNIVMREFLL